MDGAGDQMTGNPRPIVEGSFEALVNREHQRLAEAREADRLAKDGKAKDSKPAEEKPKLERPVVSTRGSADEPWVAFTSRDYFGLALSGGGIRSATFNLGLLQALEQLHLLEHVDYLSTVSGGGYAGGFWTAWRQRNSRTLIEAEKSKSASTTEESNPKPGKSDDESPLQTFPVPSRELAGADGFAPETREPPQIRHLREFSRFLIPRVGFRSGETWAAIVAVLGGALPSLSAALAVLGLLIYGWCAASSLTVHVPPETRPWVFGAVTFAWQLLGECVWRAAGKDGREDWFDAHYWLLALIATVGVGILYSGAGRDLFTAVAGLGVAPFTPPFRLVGSQRPGEEIEGLWTFALPITWGLTAVGLLLFRLVMVRAPWERTDLVRWSSAFDRVIARLLAPGLVLAGVGAIWHVAIGLRALEEPSTPGAGGVDALVATASGSAGLTALFVWLRDWLAKPPEKTRGSELLDWLIPRLKLLTPQLLASCAFVLALTATALLIQRFTIAQNIHGVIGSLIIVGVALFFFDPARVGLHDFYRSRIARGFLGAARPQRDDEPVRRPTTELPDDDVTFQEIASKAAQKRPIHLVCCAANGIAGDVLGTLYRGARSAVVSPLGISVGNHYAEPLPDLRLSSVLTASAASFNSQMGSYSMKLGPAVAFLMSALNLRLGLWLPHPAGAAGNVLSKWLPGRLFFLEMTGQTHSGPFKENELRYAAKNIHISDGGHFENLGLYELVRRRCRYIIVSDCGADPDVTFDDLGNALRRVREDFGVEIDLDTTQLRPNAEGYSRQHAVMGTIHYDGFGGTDKGLLLYFKPSLSGDEPPDVLQYRWRNPAFPQQSTVDQFYDEAQWESHRRLGVHAVTSVLRPPSSSKGRKHFVNRVFLEASQRWHPELERQDDVFLALTERCAQIEADIRENAPPFLRAEFFPEVQVALGKRAVVAPETDDDVTRSVYFLMLVLQVMEDAWVSAELETLWSHPLNEGWMNYFQRWASTPSFRRWWPVLRPIYSNGFRDFVRERFDLRIIAPDRDTAGRGATLALLDLCQGEAGKLRPTLPRQLPPALTGLAWQQFCDRRKAPITEAKSAFVYELTLENDGKRQFSPIQVGFLLYNTTEAGVVEWYANDLFVPPAMIGGGIISRFLHSIVTRFEKAGVTKLRVKLAAPPDPSDQSATSPKPAPRRDAASRLARVQEISFYKSHGFVHTKREQAGDDNVLELILHQAQQTAPEKATP